MSFQSLWNSRWSGLLIAILYSLGVSAAITGLRNLGALKGVELFAYDSLIKLRAKSNSDPRILLVAIDDRALAKLNSSQISDLDLTQTIKNLEQNQPKVIAVDILRDVPTGQGQQELLKYLNNRYDPLATQIKPIVLACKLPSENHPNGINPPPIDPNIDISSAVGFVDVDGDSKNISQPGIVRRFWISSIPAPSKSKQATNNSQENDGSIAVQEDGCYVPFSLGFLTALSYLQTENINLILNDKQLFELNNIVFKPLDRQAGAYQNLDSANYHQLLDYWYQQPAEQISIIDVLENKIDRDKIKDKVVYIGYVTKNDIHPTPFGLKPGVLIHAWTTSQILSNVLDRRPIIWYWSQPGELLWILSWGFIGAGIVYKFRDRNLLLYLSSGAALIILFGTSFYLFSSGGWIPLIPPALTLVAVVASKDLISILEKRITPLIQQRINLLYPPTPQTPATVIIPNIDRIGISETVVKKNPNRPKYNQETFVEPDPDSIKDSQGTVVENPQNSLKDSQGTVVENSQNSLKDSQGTVVENSQNSLKDSQGTVVENSQNPLKDSQGTVVENSQSSRKDKQEFVRRDPLVGKSIAGDRYQIERELGRGGMSRVYLAVDTRLLNKKVAVKIMINPYSSIDTQSLIKRFQREVEFISRLTSPNIVQISDFGILPEDLNFAGSPFYVMEYLVGTTLKKRIAEKGKLSPKEALEIVLQICYALAEAHQKNIIHRDLKPDNIFLVNYGNLGEERIKILDFGIAKAVKEQDKQQETKGLTAVGSFVGTYQYASPEQCGGMTHITVRSDIYSLGIIFYEMLSGTNPYGINSTKTTGINWAVNHMTKPAKPLRSQIGCENLSAELEEIVMKCLQKEPDRRHNNATKLIEQIKKLIG